MALTPPRPPLPVNLYTPNRARRCGQKGTMTDGLITIPVAEWRRLQGIANAASYCLGYTDGIDDNTTESELRDSIAVVRTQLETALLVGMEKANAD